LIDQEEIFAQLQSAEVTGIPVSIRRASIAADPRHGRIAMVTRAFVIVNTFDADFHLNGFSLLRTRDITAVEDKRAGFFGRLLERRPEKGTILPIEFRGCDTVRSVLSLIHNHWPIISVHLETTVDRPSIFGRVRMMGADAVVFDWITSEAVWNGTTESTRIEAITRVDFGGGYEDSLAIAAIESE
jgi:hypothetical protein